MSDDPKLASTPGVVYIARCSVHGLHGARTTCFAYEHEGLRECDGTVDQVPMVPAREIGDEIALLDGLEAAVERLREHHMDDEANAVRDIAAWIFTYGPLEEWAKGAQEAVRRCEAKDRKIAELEAEGMRKTEVELGVSRRDWR